MLGLEVEEIRRSRPARLPYGAGRQPNNIPMRTGCVFAVDSGEGEEVQVVCGAPNARRHDRRVRSVRYPYPGTVSTSRKPRFAVSDRRHVLSEREMGISEDHEGI